MSRREIAQFPAFGRLAVMLALTIARVSSAPCAEQAAAAVISPQVVLEDRYPQRHINFAGGVVGIPDLVYETLPGFRPLHLDLYQPASKQGGAAHPFVVYVHGGGWTSGHTRQSGAFSNWPDVLASVAARGYVVVSVEYRLSGEARFPAAFDDVKAAIQWLKKNAAQYGIDPARGIVWGASAGGQLAALTALTCDCVQGAIAWYGIFDFQTLAAQRDPGSTAFPDSDTSADARYLGCRVSACAPEVVAAASAVTHIQRSSPPMLLIHGVEDKTVPVKQSQEMYDRLRAAGASAELFLVPGVDHSFIGKTPAQTQQASRAALKRVFEFIAATIGG